MRGNGLPINLLQNLVNPPVHLGGLFKRIAVIYGIHFTEFGVLHFVVGLIDPFKRNIGAILQALQHILHGIGMCGKIVRLAGIVN
ncbi:hypothetical protein D3C81_2108710 [compost metagenome]